MIGPIQIGAGLAVIGVFVWMYFRDRIRRDRSRTGLEQRVLRDMIARERDQIRQRQRQLGTYDFERRNITEVLVPNPSIDLTVVDLAH